MKLNLLVVAMLAGIWTQAAPQAAPTSVKDFAGLQKEITDNNNSSSGDAKLSIDANLTADANLMEVKKDLTLTGKEATKTLDGANKYAGFFVTGGGNSKLTLKDLLLQNFKEGTVNVNSGSVADITNVTFSSNSAIAGGAIYNEGTAMITNATFSNNSADGNGGAIFNAMTATITNAIFKNNSAINGFGGAIFNDAFSGSAIAKINNTSFTDNKAAYGGAIFNTDAAATITNGSFTGNSAVFAGGAIYNEDAATITNGSFTGNSAVLGGGAIYNDGTATITNGSFTGNSAVFAGGAIYNGIRGKVAITNATFSNNSAGAEDGGAIYNGGTATITNGSFIGNSAVNGGAIYNVYGGTLTVDGATFKGNIAKGTKGNDGGAIYNKGTARITNATFLNNSVDGNGGAIYNDEGGTVEIVASTKDVEFTGNTAGGKSNAIHNKGLVYFKTDGSNKVIVNDAITGGGYDPQLEIDGNVSFNNDVSGNDLRVDGWGTLDFGDKGKFNDDTHNVLLNNGATLNLANGTTSEAIVAKDVSVADGGKANVVVDVDLANTAVDSIKAGSSNQNGKFQFDNFRMLSDAAGTVTAVTVFTGTDSAKPTMGVAGTTFTSNYKYDVTAADGALTFTRGNDTVDGVAEALTEASTGVTVSLSLTEDYNAKVDLGELNNAGELTVFGQGKTLNGNGNGGFNVTNGMLNMEDATMSGFNSALTVGTDGAAAITGVNFTGNTAAIVNNGELTFTDCSFTDNRTDKGTAGAIYNKGIGTTLNIVASNQDVVFGGNSAAGVSNAIHNEGTSELYLDASGHRQIVFNDSITGADTSAIVINEDKGTGTIVLNAAMDNYKGAVVLDAGTLQLGANGTFFNGASALTLKGGMLDFANGRTQDHTFNKLTLKSGADVKMHVDADLAAVKMDTLTGTVSSLNGNKIDVSQIRLLSDAATETLSLTFADANLKSAVKYSGSDVTYSPIFKYSAAYNEADGMFTFTRSNSGSSESFNPAVLASPIASQVGGYLTQLATYQQAFMGMERHMLLTSNLRANVSNSAPDTTKAQFDQNDLWIRPYTTYETVELDHGPNVDNVAWGTIVGFDSRLHDLGHEFDGGLSFYAGYNGSQQTYQSKDIVQHGGVLGMTGVLYRGNFFSGLTISGGASQAKADTDYGTDNFTILTAGIAAQTGYNWEVVKDRFIIQPGFSASYTFVKAYDYTSSSGVAIDSDPFHTVTLEPGLKFIGNLDHGWQPYCGVSMVWNLMGETETEANTIELPEMSIKPYVKGNVGVQKLFTDSLSGYLQLYGMGGGRDSIGVQLGFSGAF